MKKKILSIALVLGMLLSLLSSVPVSADAASNRSLSYAFFDYEDGVANLQDATIVDGGMAGSAKSLKYTTSATTYEDKALTIDGTNPVTGTVPAGETLKVTFNLKLSRALTNGNLGLKLSDGTVVDATFNPANTDWQKVTFTKVAVEELALTSLAIRFGSSEAGGNVTTAAQHTYYIDDMELSCAVVPGTAPMTFDDYTMDFENGSSVTFNGAHITAEGVSSGSDARGQLIADPTNPSNTVMSIYLASNVDGEGYKNGSREVMALRFAESTVSTNLPTGTIAPGETLKLTFRYYLPQEMESSNKPTFAWLYRHGASSVGHLIPVNDPYYNTGTTPATEANQWHTVEFKWTNNGTSDRVIGSAYNNFRIQASSNYHYPAANKSWIVSGGSTSYNFGNRYMYFDDFRFTIGSDSSEGGSSEPEGPAKPESSALAFTGTFAKGQQVTFSHTFSPATEGAADNSIVRLVATKDGKSASLGSCAVVGGSLTVPVIPEGASLKFEVVPKDSNGAVGDVVAYDYATVVGSYGAEIDLELSAAGVATAVVTAENYKVDGTDINAILVVLLYDRDGAVVGFDKKSIVCANEATVSGEDGTLVVTPAEGVAASVTSAKAYLWYCNGTPSLSSTTMETFAPSVSATRAE